MQQHLAELECGGGHVIDGRQIGCGKPFVYDGEIYRCADCDTPFHKQCLRKHFEQIKEGAVKSVRQFPEQSNRVESGPAQFGDDWPGLFLRGDTACIYGLQLEQLRLAIENGDFKAVKQMAVLYLPSLVENLSSCDIHNLNGGDK